MLTGLCRASVVFVRLRTGRLGDSNGLYVMEVLRWIEGRGLRMIDGVSSLVDADMLATVDSLLSRQSFNARANLWGPALINALA